MDVAGATPSLGRRDGLFFVVLFAAVFLAYRPAWNGGLLWDDAAHLTREGLRSWHGLWRIWFEPGATQQYYPLLHSAFWVQHRLWGDAPAGYHLVNLGLHFSAAALAALALRRLSVPGAYFAAAIFALHPVHVESVAWITEQKNTLSAVFYLGAALAWLRFEDRRESRAYLLALLLFVLALCSKTVTATLPAALLLLHWWKRGPPSWRRDMVPLLPFFILGAASGLFTAWVERNLVGAQGAAFDRTLVERGLIAGRAAWFYLGKLVWPADLVFIYPRWSVSQATSWQYLYPAAALAALAALWRLRKRMPGALVAALFFLGTLFPALGFFDLYPFLFSFVADHFQYLASLGVLALAGAGAARVLDRAGPGPRSVWYGVCLTVVAGLAVLTFRQSGLYADRETLYRATLQGNPGCWMAWNNLAGAVISRGDAEEGMRLAHRALALRPDYPEAHNNLGLALGSRGDREQAIAHLREAVRLDPAYAEAHNNLGFALAGAGDTEEAISHYRTALQLDPDRAGIHYNLAMALIARQDLPAAAAQLRTVIELDPGFVEAHNNLGILLARSGRLDEAIEQFREALGIAPESAEVRRNLEIALARSAGAGR
jgi:Flp pilus assembly protein TadD